MRPMDVTDWAAAKAIWEAVKESGLDLQDDVVVFLGIGPDGSLDVMVQPVDDMEEDFEEEIEFLKARVRQLGDVTAPRQRVLHQPPPESPSQ